MHKNKKLNRQNTNQLAGRKHCKKKSNGTEAPNSEKKNIQNWYKNVKIGIRMSQSSAESVVKKQSVP